MKSPQTKFNIDPMSDSIIRSKKRKIDR